MSVMTSDQELLNAFIAEFPDAHIVNNAAAGGEFEDAWNWLFDLAGKMRPAITDGLRDRVRSHFTEDDYHDWYVAKVDELLVKLPRKESVAA